MIATSTFAAPLTSLRGEDAPIAGGKGANLGELAAAGFPVPEGFVLTTSAYELAAHAASVDPSNPASARERLRAVAVPNDVAHAARDAYRSLGGGRVAVRSSATAEDLPGASFAGQQDTYLGIEGGEALLDSIRRCWASLWNERAVAYRTQNGIDDRTVALAVVVQRMVDSSAAGVLFTADPITGRRGRVVVDAAPGLGDGVVSGAITPDHYVADPRTGEILERAVRDERAVLDDARVRHLAEVGVRIEAHFGAPQDIEFAFDGGGRLWIVQSRPITTLYPLPAHVADPATDPRAYFSFNVAQGYFAPLTPMGIQAFRLILSGNASAFGLAVRDPIAGPALIVEAGCRIFIDVTPLLRHPVGREALQRFSAAGEARSSTIFAALAAHPGFALRPSSRVRTMRRIVSAAIRSGIPASVVRLIARPEATRDRYLRDVGEVGRIHLPESASASERLDTFERLLLTAPPKLLPRLLSMVIAGVVSLVAVRRLMGSRATEDEIRTLTRGAPHNPTTQMDLALWALASEARSEPSSRGILLERSPAELAELYRRGALPRRLQQSLAAFLDRYGFRAIGEIDLGVRRWAEDPTHILGAVANYLRLGDDAPAPDVQFARGAGEAETAAASLLARIHGPRRALVGFFLRRVRALVGLREVPKFTIVRALLSRGRELLAPIGVELAATGRIASPDDIYFLTLPEARRALAGQDLRSTVAQRHAMHVRELARRHIPRVLLSDGTDAEVAYAPPREGGLRGSPASPGSVSGVARVVRSPAGARIEPGEILVAPSTDPGWTPLFLTAGGLVMEMGGMMSHGAVVAREYGIPAVVGVADATELIATGQRVSVDGSAGVVSLEAR